MSRPQLLSWLFDPFRLDNSDSGSGDSGSDSASADDGASSADSASGSSEASIESPDSSQRRRNNLMPPDALVLPDEDYRDIPRV